MKTYASRTGLTLYPNARIEKRNPYTAPQKRLFKNTEATRRPVVRNAGIAGASPAVDSIIRFFKGTLVTADPSGIEWGAR